LPRACTGVYHRPRLVWPMDNPLRGLDPVTQNVVTGLVLAHVAALVLWCMLACCSGPSKRQKAE